MHEAFKKSTEHKIEGRSLAESIDNLIDEFPEQLHDALLEKIKDLDDQTARDFLVSRLIERKQALVTDYTTRLPSSVEVITHHPDAVQESIERAHEQGSEYFLGRGDNAEVLASTRQEGVCYKTLFLERAKTLGVNVAREAVLLYEAGEIVNSKENTAKIPKVKGYVQTPQVKAIKMETLSGFDLAKYLAPDSTIKLPQNFDIETFFRKLKNAVHLLNEHGYYHRDLFDNAGNIFVDEQGEPYILDFGSAIKSIDPDHATPEGYYQIVPGGTYYKANDYTGIAMLEQRVREKIAA